MNKRIIIFDVGLDRELDIYEYGNSDSYKDLCEEVVNGNMDSEKFKKCIMEGGSWYVRGVSGLLEYYKNGDVWEREDEYKFLKNVIKYKDIDIDWNEDKEEDFIYDFFNDENEYRDFCKKVLEEK